jgi:dipeptidyl aminopeptidase/acylaminoacyl peptidase
MQMSPVPYCQQVTTATLLRQGDDDGRCPRGQSEELFANLVRRANADVELVMYLQRSHAGAESGRRGNPLDYHQRLARWLEKHAKNVGFPEWN